MADDNDLINRLAAVVADRIRPQIPFDYEMWDIATIAACMKLSEAQVRERLARSRTSRKRSAFQRLVAAEVMRDIELRTVGRG